MGDDDAIREPHLQPGLDQALLLARTLVRVEKSLTTCGIFPVDL